MPAMIARQLCGALRRITFSLSTLVIVGCASSHPPPHVTVDLSSPKAAANTFVRAISIGDAGGAKAASVGTNSEKQSIDAMVSFITGLRAYDQALMRRFGSQAIQVHSQIDQTLQHVAEQPIRDIEDPLVTLAGDRAVVQPAYKGIKLSGRAPLLLTKVKDGWKVDLAATAERDRRFSPEVTRQFADAGRALHDNARLVSAGRFKTLAEAQQGAGP